MVQSHVTSYLTISFQFVEGVDETKTVPVTDRKLRWDSSASETVNPSLTVSHPVWEQTASSRSPWSPSPRGAPCWGWVWGWDWDAARRLPGGECATSHPGRCSSRWSAHRWSRVRPLGSPGFQRSSWDLRLAEECSIYSKYDLTFVTCNLFICISCLHLFQMWRKKHPWNETPSFHPWVTRHLETNFKNKLK